jgi:hypothetical protein
MVIVSGPFQALEQLPWAGHWASVVAVAQKASATKSIIILNGDDMFRVSVLLFGKLDCLENAAVYVHCDSNFSIGFIFNLLE